MRATWRRLTPLPRFYAVLPSGASSPPGSAYGLRDSVCASCPSRHFCSLSACRVPSALLLRIRRVAHEPAAASESEHRCPRLFLLLPRITSLVGSAWTLHHSVREP